MNDEYSFPHPIHGSTSGTNFGVNIAKNVWYCRRCNSGGSVIHLVAMMESLIDCSSLSMPLPDDIRIQTIGIIKEKFGVDLWYETKVPLNDTYNANMFSKYNEKNLKYCESLGGWYFYNGQKWELDSTNKVRVFADDIYRKLTQETPFWVPTIFEGDSNDEKKNKSVLIKEWKTHVKNSGDAAKLANMVTIATKDLSVREEDFDSDANLICLENCIFDLKTFTSRPFDYRLLITKQANFVYDPAEECPNWERFLRIVFQNDEKLIRYFKKALGYCLTAEIHGGGANGKSTLMDTIMQGMGDYATTIRAQSLLKKKDGAIPNDLACLRKMRLIVAAELESCQQLDTSIVKDVTSKKPIKVRFLHKEFFDMKPTFKVFLETNPLPSIKGDDNGTWRRIKKIPFNHKFSEAEKIIDYDKKYLYPELSGIFNSLVQGLKDLNENGEQEPEVVKMATQGYRESENSLHEFIELHCYPLEETKNVYTLSSEFNIYYRKITENEGEYPYGKKTLPALLEACGIKRIRLTAGEHSGKNAYLGVRGKTEILFTASYKDNIVPPKAYTFANELANLAWTE